METYACLKSHAKKKKKPEIEVEGQTEKRCSRETMSMSDWC